MKKEYFVDERSIVRQIWGRSDTILFIFAGAAAEFALNKSVDWLYFTGRLPADPVGRLFSTVSYARAIVFSEKQTAWRTIDAMTQIHAQVEAKRGTRIPDQAYRDVLFMLTDYSIRAFEVLEHKLGLAEKKEVFDVFNRLGNRMGLRGLPRSFEAWQTMRKAHLQQNLQYSEYTNHLFAQYRKHLGGMRYRLLLEVQACIMPGHVRNLLGFHKVSFLYPVVVCYRASRVVKLDGFLKSLILPARYRQAILALDKQLDKQPAKRSAPHDSLPGRYSHSF
ncbi:MAG: DUF2236 domain-containing protein [Cyclobacteriaceae bacterium]|nr:DUF2236 domain-containing protein [Cyclobacteriaceae bacterium]